jgi:TRAP-type C4-dicarboxylate transport system permease small subunit
MGGKVEDLQERDELDGGIAESHQGGWFSVIASILAAIGTLWIFFLMFLIVADVIGRNFLNMPITGVAEFAGRSVVAIVFLTLAGAIGSGRMTRAGFLLQIIGHRAPRLRLGLEVIFCCAGMLIFLVLAYASWPEFANSWRVDEYFGVRGVYMIPTWPFRGLVVLGAAMAAAAYFFLAWSLIRGGAAKLGDAQ